MEFQIFSVFRVYENYQLLTAHREQKSLIHRKSTPLAKRDELDIDNSENPEQVN